MLYRLALVSTWAVLSASSAVAQSPDSQPADAQPPSEKQLQPRPLAQDFDIRSRYVMENLAAREDNPSNTLYERRVEASRNWSGRAGRQTGDARIALNNFGLPKSISVSGGALRGTSEGDAVPIAIAFLRENRTLFQLDGAEIDTLRLLRRERVQGLTYLRFVQRIAGADVFDGQLRVVVDARGRVIEAGAGSIVPGLRPSRPPSVKAPEAALAVQRMFHFEASEAPAQLENTDEVWNRFVNPVGSHLSPLILQPVVFPLDAARAVHAWRALFEIDGLNWYEIVIDAGDGRLLFLQNLYRNASGTVWKSSPVAGYRETVEFPGTWFSGDETVTTGNNADTYLDADNNNQPDMGSIENIRDGRAYAPSGNFDFPAGDRTTTQNPRSFKAASTTSLFYFVNRAHDYFYALGFDEAAGNLQADNFGRGGAEGDRVLAEAQDGGMTNNASMSVTPDGTSPRMQMGLWTHGSSATTSHTDSSYDGMVVFHEYAHTVTTRMVGGGSSTSCLTGTHSRAMGEGWSDYFAVSAFDNPVISPYLSLDRFKGLRRNSYERYPYTYEDMGNHGFSIYGDGEIWAATLVDARSAVGAETMDKLVVAALRLTPCRPSFADARDAILLADEQLFGKSHHEALWRAFAARGLGYSATGYDGSWRLGSTFTAAYDLPAGMHSGNRPPVVKAGALPVAVAGQELVYRIEASDPDGGLPAFRLLDGPDGLTVSGAGEVRWNAVNFGREAHIEITDGQGGRVMHGMNIVVVTPITAGSPLQLWAPERFSSFATIQVPENTLLMQVTLHGGWGDTDVAIADPNMVLFGISLRDGTRETVSIPRPKAGEWFIEVAAYRRYDGVSLTATFPEPQPIDLASTITGLSGEFTSETFYKVTVPAGETGLRVQTTLGPVSQGDLYLYVRKGSPATCQAAMLGLVPCYYDRSAVGAGRAKSIVIPNPEPDDYYISLHGYSAYSGVNLRTVQPVLNVSPADLTFTGTVNGASPPSQSLRISEQEGASLSWAAAVTSENTPWLTVSPATGFEWSNPLVSANQRGLAAGSYTGAVTITVPGFKGSPKEVKVTLRVN